MAKILIIASFIALALGVWLAASPVQNPGVQDCGAPLAFVIVNRTDVKVAPGSGPNAGALILQPTCRERVDSQLLRGMVAFGAFLGLGLLGSVIGLLDDRWRYHKAPRLESLLREPPKDAPGRLRPPPVVEEEELGVALPPIEGPDVMILLSLTALTVAVLLAFGGFDDVMDAIGSVGTLGLVAVGLLSASTFVLAGLQTVFAEPDPDGVKLPAAAELSLAAASAERLLPGLGPLGLDAHALSAAGEPKHLTLRRLDARQTLAICVHLVLLVVVFVVASVPSRPEVTFPSGWWTLAAPVAVFGLVGLFRALGRYQRLVVPPSFDAVREAIEASRQRTMGIAGGALALTIVNATAFVLSLSLVAAIDGGLPASATVARLALVYLVSCVAGALSPTPAGIGAFEPLAVLGLLLSGVDAPTAVAGVLLFRAATIYLPFLIGLIPFIRLRRRGVI